MSSGYSVLTHEAIVDAAWDVSIKPLLLMRFPDASPEELREAHAYTYGGSIIQDLGYYPFGNKFFSNLTHYVRSGDFVEALVAEAEDLNEYALPSAHWNIMPGIIVDIRSRATERSRCSTHNYAGSTAPKLPTRIARRPTSKPNSASMCRKWRLGIMRPRPITTSLGLKCRSRFSSARLIRRPTVLNSREIILEVVGIDP